MKLLKNIQQTYHQELDVIYGNEEVDSFFYLLIEHYFDISRLQLAMDLNRSISSGDVLLMESALEQLKQEKPIQYIIGETEFFRLSFKVDKNVLIPRPETEELVALVLQNIKTQNPKPKIQQLHILDIGTGSGCIAISLAKNLPKAKVYALDVSKNALKIAKENAKLNNVDIEFIEADILNWNQESRGKRLDFFFPYEGKMASRSEDGKVENWNLEFKDLEFDMIVSNPPYVRNQEKEEIKKNVLDNEPHLALFVDNDDALKFYKAICEFSVDKLTDNGLLFFEINEYLGQEMKALLEQYSFKNIELKKDLFGKDRMIKATK